jgi:SulP family sulfate permease
MLSSKVEGPIVERLSADLLAGTMIALMLLPQAVAFATLAGLPPQAGLYASLAPLLAYALLGSSPLLSVGPVAVTALMTASAAASVSAVADPVTASATIALLTGAFLIAGGIMRLGSLARFLSQPVISGFVSGTAVLIIVGQLAPLVGASSADGRLFEPLAAAFGLGAMLMLFAARRAAAALSRPGLAPRLARFLSGLAPFVLMVASSAAVAWLGLRDRIDVVGHVPAGFPQPVLPALAPALLSELWLPALLIAVVVYASSIAIAQAVSGDRRPPDGNAEMRGLGAANLASALSGGFAVAGSLSRTAVAREAGARSRMAGIGAAMVVAVVLLTATAFFRTLPTPVVAAVLIVVAWGMIDVRTLRETWRYDRAEGAALLLTAAGVVFAGVETGIGLGIALSLAILVRRASRPHIAVVGRVPGTEHFRNVEHHTDAETDPAVLMLRIDENLFFGNVDTVERRLTDELRARGARYVVLIMSSVSHVDATAVKMLRRVDEMLRAAGGELHLAEVKWPVMDRLGRGGLLETLSGRIHLSAWSALEALRCQGVRAARELTDAARDRDGSDTS